jgi:pyridoxine/pyridoxamine 5'-phosphate oxidase
VGAITRAELLAFMRAEPYAVQASVSTSGAPQAAVVGIVVTDQFEIFFDTLSTSRKAQNLRHNPTVAFVIGPTTRGSECTVQLEGAADEPTGAELERLLNLYFAAFPDGRERQAWPSITYFRVTPTWLRYSDYSVAPPQIVECQPANWPS